MVQNSRSVYVSRWGITRHYAVYFGTEADAGSLGDTVAVILDGARQGHLFTLLLHRRQYSVFRKMGWNGLHTGIRVVRISSLFALRDFQRKIAALRSASPDLLAVRGCNGVSFPGVEVAISKEELLSAIQARTTNASAMEHSQEA